MIKLKSLPNLNKAIKKQKHSGTNRALESIIHKAIAQYLRTIIKRPSRWQTIEVSNNQSGKWAMINQKQRTAKGIITGWPDIEIFITKHYPDFISNELIFLEIKIPGKDAEPHQAALHKELREDGHEVFVVHSVDEVKDIFEKLGII